MKWTIVLVAVLVILVSLVVGIGMLLPIKHRVSASVNLPVSAEKLWQTMTDFSAYPSWRTGVMSVAQLADANGHAVWQEVDRHGESIPYETLASISGRRLVRRIANPDLPFGGSWTFELAEVTNGTTLTLTEEGEVYHPVYRFVSRFLMGQSKNIESYLSDIRVRLSK